LPGLRAALDLDRDVAARAFFDEALELGEDDLVGALVAQHVGRVMVVLCACAPPARSAAAAGPTVVS
jgi:hypothetical protein